ncbi:hypothetical protein DVS28_b0246 (plasmid) [Euzebya pacifica]|uniref:Uncharacterized protein n=1 Tax=Euzebya pacifica TaxID=1608957 RepID=A0A346Y6B9_9ACTN|nr:hypothetical protein [Euzebya pacifica]AXV10016.1 hypothetical protein DVS28_b0246 [Euzebya pacifica]
MPTAPNSTGVFFAGATDRSGTHGNRCPRTGPTDRGHAAIETNDVVLAAPAATERLTAQETP